MKFRFLLLFSVIAFSAAAQSPSLINYQGLLRNSAGVPVGNRSISVKFELRQGSPGGTTLFTEQQNISTGPLGLFNLQIGRVNTGDFAQVNWQNGPVYLNVAIDTAGGTGFTELGSQQLVSVPYALNARNVATSYSNNTLKVGDSLYVLNTAKSVSLTSGNSNITVTGTYPDLSISSSPTLQVAGNELSISNGNTITVAPTLSISGYTLMVGPPGNTVALPSAGSPSITGLGMATVTAFGGTNFTVNVPSPTLTGAGSTSVSGGYPNYVISTPAPTITGLGASTVTGIYPNFTINTPSTSLVGTAGTTVQGNFPNYTVTSYTPNIQGAGATTVSGNFPNYTVNTPSTSLLGTAGTTVQGNFPNYTITSFTPNIQGAGASTVTGNFPNYTVNTPSTSLLGTAGTTVQGNFPNYTITSFTPNIQGAGATTVSGSFPNYSVNTPSTSLLGTVGTTVQGNFPNYTITSFTPNIQGAGAATVTGSFPNYVVNSFTPVIQGQGATSVAGIFPNYTVTTTVPTVTATGLAQTSVSGNTLTIHVPTLTYTGATGVLSSGTNTVLAVPTLTYTNNVLRSGPASNTVFITESPWTQTASAVLLNDTSTKAVGIGTSSPGINAGSARYLTISGTGTYTTATAALELQGGSLNTNIPFGKIDFNSVGPSSNSNSVRISAYRSGNVTEGKLGLATSDGTSLIERILINENGDVGIGTTNPVRNLQVQSSAHTSVALVAANGSISSLSFGNPGNHFLGNIRYENSTGLMSFWTSSTPDRFVIAGNGNVGVGTNAPSSRFHTEVSNGRFRVVNFSPAANTILLGEFVGLGTLAPQQRFMMTGGGPLVDIGQNPNGDFVVESNDSPKFYVQNSGVVGITGTLSVVDGSQADGKVMVSNSAGLGKWESTPSPVVFTNLNNSGVTVSSGPTPLGAGTLTFTKGHTNTKVEIDVYTRAHSGTAVLFFPYNYVRFEIYVDGNTSPYSTEHVIFGSNVTEYVSLKSVFTGLSAGSHTITIRANTDGNNALNVLLDPGGYGGKVIVQEKF